ncbi:DODA-type extradiol aromatic ring-opening family dioxygenase [Halomonas ventosae]|uniref:Aromatic ring-opening dioxygenase catalytic subunit (LigB family) n=1 Tax=Halomonas ventosae TaxID=229007 RepID=A0A2T0VAW6_9GAMM|nr:class III extradiol ring-cleavage dioxygenase [Halomonas ventosae]PRY67336.1 aromatic ring-opening dioxygenase catalytic subunit (LigB family) [Halomonas ventosae]
MTPTDILFISHGGGPMPLLGDPGHREMVERLQEFAGQLRRPAAILVISAHWEEAVPTLTSGANPPLIYDYHGFPPESYAIEYPCPGAPALARQIHQALEQAGMPARLDDRRGFDHGLFVPLKLMYPEADIPCVQLSLVDSLDAETHLAMGRALQALDVDNLLVIGSGFSFHNMRAFFAPGTPETQARNQAFEEWLEATCSDTQIEETERTERLRHWERAPHARFCHPREEHLLPLHVCYGLAGKPSESHVSATILGKQSGMFHWRVAP